MGANAVTTVPVYTAGEVLTAADLNITNSGIPVFASLSSVTRLLAAQAKRHLPRASTRILRTLTQHSFTMARLGCRWVLLPGLFILLAPPRQRQQR
jgi:hypothetical protein